MKLGVAIIGCGDMGKQHASAWQARDDSFVATVYDPQKERSDALAARVGARACESFEEAITHDDVAAVSVCVPVGLHSEVACFAAQNGRHVLTEKAIALTVEQAEAMIAAAKANDVHLSVSFQYRAFPRYQRYRELFQNGDFGGPVFVRYEDIREVRPKLAMHSQALNGGPVIDMAGHYFDLMRYFTGEEPQSVFATGHIFGKGKPRLATVDDLAIDAASIEVRMGGGHSLHVFVNWGMPEGFPGWGSEQFVGPVMSARPVDGQIECTWADKKERLENSAPTPPGPAARVADLASAIINGTPLEVTGEDGLAALRVSLGALESVQTGRAVSLQK